jgi:hypothetical protein
MATKKEIARKKAIEGGMPSDVADNIFRMQIGKHGSQNTPGTFRVKDQKTMAMSTMFQTPDPEGELGTLDISTPDQTVTSIQVDEIEVPRYMGSENFQKAFGDARKAGLKTFTFGGELYNTKLGPSTETQVIETEFKDTIPGEKASVSAFDKSFDAAVGANKKAKSTTSKPSKTTTTGMVDTFSALDTRQAQRKAIVEARKQKRAKLKALRAKKRAGGIKDETMEFGGFGPDLSGKKVTKSKKKVFKEAKRKIKQKAAEQRARAMERISAQGQAQRAAGKNPAITTEFDPSAEAPFLMKPMKFRKKYKK